METFIICVLLSASIIGLTFIIERGLALRVTKIIPSAVVGALEMCRTDDDLPMLRRICQQNPSPLSRLLLLADRHRQWPRAENSSALETSARREVSRLERGLVVLEIVVGIAPLLGLVGTIYGLIELFATLGASGLNDNSALAHGISIALISTLLGLLTAIPSLIAWSYYNKKVENHAIEMAALCDNFLRQLYHGDETPEASDTLVRRTT
ncbi:MAG TPA: MotA/TolQ/ExbB proton channel family protein [Verrucomicrobiae bacterium]|jgi:biopolymer transport protein ExbB|nr:MotA/TolQ/ExbB proton channel family protein [Verrucomicrobiae bacterium]